MNLVLLILACIAVILYYLQEWFWFIVVLLLIGFIIVSSVLKKSAKAAKKAAEKIAEVTKKEAAKVEEAEAKMPEIGDIGKEALEGFKGLYYGKPAEKPINPNLEAPIGYTREITEEEKHPNLFAPWKNTIKTAGNIADRFIKMLQKLFKF